MLVLLVIFGFLFGSHYGAAQWYEGDNCTLQSGQGGTCKSLKKCQTARNNMKKGIFPKTCGFVNHDPIVCCSKNPVAATGRRSGEIADQMCRNYSQYIWTVELNPTLLVGGKDIRRRECPRHNQRLVTGGNPASGKEFPHMAQLGYKEEPIRWRCGGALISDQYILTTAHCLVDETLGEVRHARMGLVDLTNPDHKQRFRIVKRIAHPKYVPPAYYHDIGLAQLDRKPKMNSVIATGWGNTEFEGYESTVLMRVALEMYDSSRCDNFYRRERATDRLKNGVKDKLMICAGPSTELKHPCQGASGGPLHLYRNGNTADESCMYDVIGVMSFGKGRKFTVDTPVVYTRVFKYIKWIEDQVWSVNR